jgi:hypothetical protein
MLIIGRLQFFKYNIGRYNDLYYIFYYQNINVIPCRQIYHTWTD